MKSLMIFFINYRKLCKEDHCITNEADTAKVRINWSYCTVCDIPTTTVVMCSSKQDEEA